jgi:mannose-6-phosphate isomerase-like protein (cupin superfamily)
MTELLARNRFQAPIDPATVAAEWRGRGYSCSRFVDPPGQCWEDFMHGCNELVTVVEGRLEMVVGGETVTLAPGDEVFIPKGALHSVRNIHHGTSVWLYGYD